MVRRLNRKAAVACLFLAAGCAAQPTTEDVIGSPTSIVGGTRDMQPAIVVVYNRASSGMCTGTIIAPRVVLTAKHCVQEPFEDGPSPARSFVVGIGDSVRSISEVLEAQDVRTTPGVYTDGSTGLGGALVGIDVAVLILARGTTITPLPYRHDAPTDQVGHTVTVVGFGQTPAGETGVKYHTDTRVNGIRGSVIYIGPAICQGDSGGPMIQSTGEIIGVASFGTGECGSGLGAYNALFNDIDIIDQAIRDSGDCVNDGAERCDGYDNDCNGEVDETCTPLGQACARSDECIGGWCGDTRIGRICTAPCDPMRPSFGCSPGLYCSVASGCDGLCIPGVGGTFGEGMDCTDDTQCASLFCADPGDGRSRCLLSCKGDSGMCFAGEACAAAPGACGGCVTADIVRSAAGRGLGEPCVADADCGSSKCLTDVGAQYCTRLCDNDDAACGDGFHCRTDVCVRGRREGLGSGCVENADCGSDTFCAAQGGTKWCTRFCSTDQPCDEGFSCVDAGGAFVCAPDLGLVGMPCHANDECISGMCALSGASGVCVRLCSSEAPCTTGFECRLTSDGHTAACVAPIPALPATPPESDGCAAAPGHTGTSGAAFALIALAALALRRRRRRRR